MGFVVSRMGVAALLILPAIAAPARPNRNKEYITVPFCDLLRNPELYNHKLIRTSAIYRYGYEWSELYCLECETDDKTWLDFDKSFALSTRPSVRRKLGKNGFKGRTLRVIVLGEFDADSGYGHMGSYPFRLLVNSVEKANVILNDSPSPASLPKQVLKQIHCPKIPLRNRRSAAVLP
jgi:hypothetical protein